MSAVGEEAGRPTNSAAVITPASGLEYWARLDPDRPAVIAEGRELSFGDLAETVSRTAAFLASRGIKPGHAVAMSLRNSVEALTLPLAAARLGCQISPVSFRLRTRELQAIVSLANPQMFVYGQEVAASIQECRVPSSTLLISEEELAASVLSHPKSPTTSNGFSSPSEGYTLLWTSGTSGDPKRVIGSLGARMNWIHGIGHVYRVADSDSYLAAMSMMHSAGFTLALAQIFFGARVHILPRFQVEKAWDVLYRKRITSVLLVPTMAQMLLDADPDPSRPLPALRSLLLTGSAVRPALHARLLSRFPDQIYTYYGSTESPSMTVLLPEEQAAHPDSAGRPFLGVQLELRNMREVEGCANPVGEIFARNPFGMDGYLPPSDARPGDSEDWIRTGDLGSFDSQGYLDVIGRESDVIISGGLNVSLQEIERVLAAHPSVADVTVVGLDDKLWGQVPGAAVVLAGRVEPRALDEYCRAEMADYKVPKRYAVVKQIPRTASGKPLLRELRALFTTDIEES